MEFGAAILQGFVLRRLLCFGVFLPGIFIFGIEPHEQHEQQLQQSQGAQHAQQGAQHGEQHGAQFEGVQPSGAQHAAHRDPSEVPHTLQVSIHALQPNEHTRQSVMPEHVHNDTHGMLLDGTQVLGVHPVGNPPHGIQVSGPHTGVSTEGRHVDGVHPSGSDPPHGIQGEHGTQGLQTPHRSTQQGVQKPHMSMQSPSIAPCVTVLITAPFKASSRLPVLIRVSVPLIKGINSGLPVATAAMTAIVLIGSSSAFSIVFAAVSATVPTTSETAETAEHTTFVIASTTPPISDPQIQNNSYIAIL